MSIPLALLDGMFSGNEAERNLLPLRAWVGMNGGDGGIATKFGDGTLELVGVEGSDLAKPSGKFFFVHASSVAGLV